MEIVTSLKTERLGFESGRLTYLQFQKLKDRLKADGSPVTMVATENLVEDLRVIKDEGELDAIQQSLALAEGAFEAIAPELSPGITEKELAWSLEQAMREMGAEAIAFPPIVAFGPNAALPHAVPTNRTLREGEPILFDWGARLNGYCSDISRTLVLGRPDKTFKKIYQTVLDAQRKAVEQIKPGISTQEVDKIARDHIADMGYGDFFGHGLGHGVGLATHERPHLSPMRPTTLEAGMVTTVEPGIYIPGWGGVRLENMVVVTREGAIVLNTTHSDGTPWL
jgi:Xaa-Pro aminopeptidase